MAAILFCVIGNIINFLFSYWMFGMVLLILFRSLVSRLLVLSASSALTAMDAERQPLLGYTHVTCRLRPLSREEVLTARQDATWRRTQFCLVIMFWAIMAMLLSAVTCMLLTSRCYDVGLAPTVPPVHMSLAPLMSRRTEYTYTL